MSFSVKVLLMIQTGLMYTDKYSDDIITDIV